MPPTILQQPQSPDELARLAGKDIYGTSVGMLRRVELWRLGNAWGMSFPPGATKDAMLPFFMQLEAQGKNPLKPPAANLDELVKQHDVTHSGESMAEVVPPNYVPSFAKPVSTPVETPVEAETPRPDAILPVEKSEFELKLEALPHGQLKKICKMRGIPQGRQDSKPTLIARIVATASGAETDNHRV